METKEDKKLFLAFFITFFMFFLLSFPIFLMYNSEYYNDRGKEEILIDSSKTEFDFSKFKRKGK